MTPLICALAVILGGVLAVISEEAGWTSRTAFAVSLGVSSVFIVGMLLVTSRRRAIAHPADASGLLTGAIPHRGVEAGHGSGMPKLQSGEAFLPALNGLGTLAFALSLVIATLAVVTDRLRSVGIILLVGSTFVLFCIMWLTFLRMSRDVIPSLTLGLEARHTGFQITVRPRETSADQELLALRETIDVLAATDVAKSRPGSLPRLRGLVAEMEQRREIGDRYRFLDADLEFHIQAAELAGLDTACEFLRSVREQVIATGLRAIADDQRMDEVLDEHRSILDAMERGDETAARRVAKEHLDKTGVRLQSPSEHLG